MKKFILPGSKGTLFLLLTLVTSLSFAQQLPKQLPLVKPAVINFSDLAKYRLAHPIKHNKRYIEQIKDRDKDFVHKPGKLGSDTISFNIPASGGTNRSVSPAPITTFNGVLDNGTDIPPDVQAAAGTKYIIATTNQEFDIYNKAGVLSSTLDIPTFFSSINATFYSDPHVVYDAAHKRFVICMIDGLQNTDGGVALAVSETSDPTGSWYVYSFDDGIDDNTDFLDYPLLGYNENWVVVTTNLYLSTTTNAEIYVFDRSSLYSGTLGTVNTFTDANIFTYAPATTFDTTQLTEYMVADNNGNNGGKGYVTIGTITGTVSSPTYTSASTVGVNSTWSEAEVDAPQNGTTNTITTDGTQMGNAVYRNGSLWFTETVYLPAAAPTYSGVDWWQIDPATPTLQQYGRIADPNGVIFNYYSSINVDSAGNALVGYTTSSPTSYASAEYSFHASTDPKNTMEGGYIYQQGLSSYYKTFGGGRNRWGDFSYTFMDPVDNSFWTDQEFAYNPTNMWGTSIANIAVVQCTGKPIAGIISAGADTVCSGEGAILNLTGYSTGGIGTQIVWQQSANGINGWSTSKGGIGDSTDTYTTTPLTSVTYYRSIVKCLNSTLSDTSTPFKIVVPNITGVPTDTFCTAAIYNIVASAIGTPVNWYTSETSTKTIATGTTLSRYISKDTTFYINVGKSSNYTVGIPDNSGTGSYFNFTFDDGLLFNAINNFTLDSVYIYANSTGVVTVNLIDADNGSTVGTTSITVTASQVNNKTVVPTNFSCSGGTNYNITASGTTVNSLYRTSAGAVYPYTVSNVVSINGPNNAAAGHYYYFYDWHLTTGCVTARIPVNVKFGITPIIAKATPDSFCIGQLDTIVLAASGGTSYQWSPISSTSNSVVVMPTTTSTYIVTGTNAKGCSGSDTIVVHAEICTGTNAFSPSNSASIYVFPDPTTGQFNLIMNNLPTSNYSVSLYNVLGQEIMESKTFVNSSNYVMPINVSEYPNGVYFIRVLSGNDEFTNRIIKR